jgi:CO/xanthine dehydrogenase Mo-binding subunit
MAPDAPPARGEAAGTSGRMSAAHAAVGGGGDESIDAEDLSANVRGRTRYRSGDAHAALDASAVVVEGRFRTSWVYQGYLEPQTATAWPDEDGGLVVETSTQAAFSARNIVCRVLGLPQRRVRVVPTPLGGAFGGKWPLFEPLVAAAARRLGRPVRLSLERREDIGAANPSQAFEFEVRIGAAPDGRLTGLVARIVADAGAFEADSSDSFAGVMLAGPYRWPAVEISAYGVRTNRFGGGPYRGPSAPPTAFVLESLLDELADRLALDRLELRRRNMPEPGDAMVDGEPWPETGMAAVLEATAATELWRRRAADGQGEGTGVALGYWPGAKDAAAALCRPSQDGSVQVTTGTVDMSGVEGGFVAIVAEVLGVDPALVQVRTVDTASAPPSPGSGGSLVTTSVGRAIRAAAEDTARQLLAAAAVELEIAESDLELVDGTVRPRGTPERAIPIGRLIRRRAETGRAPIEGHGATDQPSLAPSMAAYVARVRVDPDTGATAVLALHVVIDAGRALNPALVTDQVHGAAVQSIGWALRERLVHDERGQLLTGTFLDYALPKVEDVGRLEATIVEVPAPDGPFGAKGIGEAAVVAGAAAIANAIAAATGVRPRRLPIDAPTLWRAMAGREDA